MMLWHGWQRASFKNSKTSMHMPSFHEERDRAEMCISLTHTSCKAVQEIYRLVNVFFSFISRQRVRKAALNISLNSIVNRKSPTKTLKRILGLRDCVSRFG